MSTHRVVSPLALIYPKPWPVQQPFSSSRQGLKSNNPTTEPAKARESTPKTQRHSPTVRSFKSKYQTHTSRMDRSKDQDSARSHQTLTENTTFIPGQQINRNISGVEHDPIHHHGQQDFDASTRSRQIEPATHFMAGPYASPASPYKRMGLQERQRLRDLFKFLVSDTRGTNDVASFSEGSGISADPLQECSQWESDETFEGKRKLPPHLRHPRKSHWTPPPRDVDKDCLITTPIPPWRRAIPKEPSPLREVHMPPLKTSKSGSFARPVFFPVQKLIKLKSKNGREKHSEISCLHRSFGSLGMQSEDDLRANSTSRAGLEHEDAPTRGRQWKRSVKPRNESR